MSRTWFLVGLLAVSFVAPNGSHAGLLCSPPCKPAPSSGSSSSGSSCAPPSCFNLGFAWLMGLLGGFS